MSLCVEASYGDHHYLNYKRDVEGVHSEKNVSKSHPEVGVAVFGLGRIGTIHLDNLRRNPRARVLYCVEEFTERVNFLRNTWNLEEPETSFLKPDDIDKIFEDKRVDAVVICTPTFAHEELVLKSLESGKAVFCEKPLAISEEGIKRCLDAMEKSSKPLLTAFNRHFDPGMRRIKARVDAGDVGKVQMIKTCSRDSPKPSTGYLKISGGIFHDCAVHDLDLICWILGEYPESVSSYGHAHFEDVKELGDYDTVAIMMKFPSGALATIDLSRYSVYGYDQRLEVFGDKGMLTNGDHRPVGVELHNEKGTTAVPIFYSFASRYKEAYEAEMEHFLNVCQGLEECEISPESVLAISKIATACEQVVNTGKSLSLKANRMTNGY